MRMAVVMSGVVSAQNEGLYVVFTLNVIIMTILVYAKKKENLQRVSYCYFVWNVN